MTKLEEVSDAILEDLCDRREIKWPLQRCRDEDSETWAEIKNAIARAAINALMDHQPQTVCMVSETYDYNIGPQDAQQIWQSWLQAILDEERETVA